MAKFIPKIIGFFFNFLSFFSAKYTSNKALKLFSTPRSGKVSETQKEFLDSAEKEIVTFEDINIMTYKWTGNSKTILLAHGWESNSARWKNTIQALQNLNYTVISLDAPAHGNTSGKLFNALLYSECINKVAQHFNPEIIIGHSVGGMATVFYQFKYQNSNLKKLVLLGAPANFEGVFDRYVSMMNYNKKIENGMNQLVLEKYNHLPVYFSAANFSKEITTEALLIHDKKDKIIPYSDALLYAKNYSNSKLISTIGFGHGLQNETVLNHVLEFVKN